jgi:hypothetical protein
MLPPQSARIDALYVVMKRFDLTYSSRDNGLGPGEFDTTFFAWTMTQRRRADRDEVQLTKSRSLSYWPQSKGEVADIKELT